jgi:aarF domain-containing kinase
MYTFFACLLLCTVGQFIASSPTLFPAPYVLEFQKCLDRTDPVPWAQARVIIESDLGRPLTDVYSYVNTNVLASASIAQVFYCPYPS